MHIERYSDFVLAFVLILLLYPFGLECLFIWVMGGSKIPKTPKLLPWPPGPGGKNPLFDHLSACPKDMKLHRREEKEILSIGTTCMIIKAI